MIICDICRNEVAPEDAENLGSRFRDKLNITHHCLDCHAKITEIHHTIYNEAQSRFNKEMEQFVKTNKK